MCDSSVVFFYGLISTATEKYIFLKLNFMLCLQSADSTFDIMLLLPHTNVYIWFVVAHTKVSKMYN